MANMIFFAFTTLSFAALVFLLILRPYKYNKYKKALQNSVMVEQQWVSLEINPYLRKEVFVVDMFMPVAGGFVVLENSVGKCVKMDIEDFVVTFKPINPTDEQKNLIENLNKWSD